MFIRREDADRVIAQVKGDDPTLAASLLCDDSAIRYGRLACRVVGRRKTGETEGTNS
mgnify:CR=1 FL=1